MSDKRGHNYMEQLKTVSQTFSSFLAAMQSGRVKVIQVHDSLEFDVSADRRWYESQHPHIRKLVEDLCKRIDMTLGKQLHLDVTNMVEEAVGLEKTVK